MELASFAYELAARLDPKIAALAVEEAERSASMYRAGTAQGRGARLRIARRSISPGQPLSGSSLTPSSRWLGYYNNNRQMRLLVRSVADNTFVGAMEYPADQMVTKVVGTFSNEWSPDDPLWSQLQSSHARSGKLALSFRETEYERRGMGTTSFEGEYRAFLADDRFTGAWFSGSRLVGYFEFRHEPQTTSKKPKVRGRGLTPRRS